MKKIRHTILFALLLFLSSCGDDAIVKRYDRHLPERGISCLQLDLFPDRPAWRSTLEKLYPFSPGCPYRLSVSGKGGIHCNSNANAPRKTFSNFPSAYLRMELHRGMKLLYSYYIDLTHDVESSDLKRAFHRLQSDLRLSHSGK
ncbi:hypothetical protein [Nitratifractor sp.]